jgi:hypothetical protein
MAKRKRTPGPWRVEGRFVKTLKEKQVAECPGHGLMHGIVDAANAQLIAASPELLAASEKLVSDMEEDGYGKPRIWKALEDLRSAIYKATHH